MYDKGVAFDKTVQFSVDPSFSLEEAAVGFSRQSYVAVLVTRPAGRRRRVRKTGQAVWARETFLGFPFRSASFTILFLRGRGIRFMSSKPTVSVEFIGVGVVPSLIFHRIVVLEFKLLLDYGDDVLF